MINKRLIKTAPESGRYIALNVLCQWLVLASNIAMIFAAADFLSKAASNALELRNFIFTGSIFLSSIVVRIIFTALATSASFHSSKSVKHTLRSLILKKMLRLGPSYSNFISTAETVQIAVDGCEQLETYFGAYLPQFFYSMIAPLTLFGVLLFVNVPSAIVLFVCVPLIPLTIAAVQTVAKKLLAKYWKRYTNLGSSFLENLQGLTTLKIYKADEAKNQEMNKEAELFRRITMKVLSMQLNSIAVMDLVAYGGAALGIIMAVMQLEAGKVDAGQCVAIVLLSADFFIPMRRLGSFFHVAMNGMAASARIFKLLDLPDPADGALIEFPCGQAIQFENVSFSYTEGRDAVKAVSMNFPPNAVTAIVGESGSGKSTLAHLLVGRQKGFSGSITVGTTPLAHIGDRLLAEHITYVGAESYLFKGTVKENLAVGKENASEKEMQQALEKVHLAEFFKSQAGLETPLQERAANLSGGQRQRLAIARALLHDSGIYIFDEATSNIDAESENDIIRCIYALAETKTVILITHRLYNAQKAQRIYVMQDGKLVESGDAATLFAADGVYHRLRAAQNALESFDADASYAAGGQ